MKKLLKQLITFVLILILMLSALLPSLATNEESNAVTDEIVDEIIKELNEALENDYFPEEINDEVATDDFVITAFEHDDTNMHINSTFSTASTGWLPPAASLEFHDVPRNSWYYNNVAWAFANGITTGTSSTTFSPNNRVTRGQFVTFLYRVAGQPTVSGSHGFLDVANGQFFTTPVLWASSIGVTTGTSSTSFSPYANITREQLITMLHRYVGDIGLNNSAPANALDRFPDRRRVSSFAINAMRWGASNGIIGTGGSLNPQGNATRAETVAMLHRAVNTIGIPSPRSPQSSLGPPITLAEARNAPGLYIREGNLFRLVRPTWRYDNIGGYFNIHAVRSDVATDIQGLQRGSTSASAYSTILFDAEYQVPQLPNNANYVIIGVTTVSIFRTFRNGWTIPVGLSLWDSTIPSPGGWIRTPDFRANALLSYSPAPSGPGMINQGFVEINGVAPTNYVRRMIYTGFHYNLANTHGIIDASQNERFTFGWMPRTDWVTASFTADKKFFLLPERNRDNFLADYTIVTTREGYFEVVFNRRPTGIHCIGIPAVSGGLGGGHTLVEFVTP